MANPQTLRIAVIGAGPAGLMAAEVAARHGAHVTVFDRMPSAGRKFLLAGRGGLNLTHTEAHEGFLARYGDAAPNLAPSLVDFEATALRNWCTALGIATFVGSSGRVFPTAMKTSPLLRAWLRRLDASGVRFAYRHVWRGWDGDGALRFDTPGGATIARADSVVLALGGASWPQLGTDGGWVEVLRDADIDLVPLAPANCGFVVGWSAMFRDRFEGQPLKSIAIEFDGAQARGDVVVTRAGVEGGPIYALSGRLREALARGNSSKVRIALRPDLSHEALVSRLAKRAPKSSFATMLRKTLGLSPVAVGLLREALLPDHDPSSRIEADGLARLINDVPLRLEAPMPVARAISTAGGVDFQALDETLMLRQRPGVFVAGEMLDWEAPTGGYLLQACFATGRKAGQGALAWAERRMGATVEGESRSQATV